MKRVRSLLLAAVPAFSYADVTGGAWYAEAVEGLRERGIMNGVDAESRYPAMNGTKKQGGQ